MPTARASAGQLDELEQRIDRWLAEWQANQPGAPNVTAAATSAPTEGAEEAEDDEEHEESERPLLLDVQRDEDVARRWYVRLAGDSRDVIAIWLTLRERTLAYETYVLPAPTDERSTATFEFVLRRNYPTVGAHYAIGPEGALFLVGQLPTAWVDEDELDRIVGSLWMYVERDFRTLLRLAFNHTPPS